MLDPFRFVATCYLNARDRERSRLSVVLIDAKGSDPLGFKCGVRVCWYLDPRLELGFSFGTTA
ncbi:hypothetical protein MUK42_11399 [Musa troglodytarum]|uniref:Uncharacterized protein n=1 Tax=Musa troglodytarum TaxID=320322 RepID=A0A9E7GXQ2_9LILI|nr:hypothetical protein MUK42_11399 [Musa troglodytarum]